MAISNQNDFREYQIDEEEEEGEGSDSDYDSDDSENDPSYSVLEDTSTKLSRLSINKKSKSVIDLDIGSDPDEEDISVPKLDEKDEKSFEVVQKLIEAGQVEKLKLEQCKVYLRKNGLRLTGNKSVLIERIKEHLEIQHGGGEKKYPASSFVLNCKGDACMGDIVMFEQNVYEMFNLASRSATGPPCGTRTVAGRIVKESYGAAKQQHTFTVEVLWSKGEKPLPPLHPLLIKGRNLYRLKTLRQRWEDEGLRQKTLMEKHSRGSLARSNREARIEQKEMRKVMKANRIVRREEPKKQPQPFQPQHDQRAGSFKGLASASQQLSTSVNSGLSAIQPQLSGLSVDHSKVATQLQTDQIRVNGFQSHRMQQPFPHKHNNYPPMNPPQGQDQMLQQPRQYYPTTQSHTDQTRGKGFQFHQMQQPFSHNKLNSFPPMNPPQRQGQRPIQYYPTTQPQTDQIRGRAFQFQHNNLHPMNPLQRPGQTQQQPCKYYAQGRCNYGDKCKFLH